MEKRTVQLLIGALILVAAAVILFTFIKSRSSLGEIICTGQSAACPWTPGRGEIQK